MDPITPAPAARFRPGDLFQSPLVRHVAGVLLTLALAWLSLKLGVAPVPVPPFATPQPAVLVIHTGGAAPAYAPLAAPAGK